MSSENPIAAQIKKEFIKRIHHEGIPRIKKCLSLLSEDQTWKQPNENLNSVGNLILHLEGNVNQWVLSTFTDKKDNRARAKEFDPTRKEQKHDLTVRLDNLKSNTLDAINNINDEDLIKVYNVQCYKETGVSILIHVIEHFSYHVGQISFYTKFLLNEDLMYYGGQSLDTTN